MKKILLLSILFIVGCDESSTESDISDLAGTWNVTSALQYENATCTGDGEDAFAGFWTNVAVNYECDATACTQSTILTCSGCAEGSTDICCSVFGGDVVMDESDECAEMSYSLSGSTVTFTTNSCCTDSTYADEEDCEANNENWQEANTITSAVTGNTFVIEDGSEGECHGYAGESQDAPEPEDETACIAGMGDWESPECVVFTFTKQ